MLTYCDASISLSGVHVIPLGGTICRGTSFGWVYANEKIMLAKGIYLNQHYIPTS